MHYVKGKGINKAPAHRFADQVDPMTNQLGVLLSLLHAHPTVQVVLHEHEAGLAKCAGGRGKHAVLELVSHLAQLHDGDEGGERGVHRCAGGVSLPGVHTQHAQHRVLYIVQVRLDLHHSSPIFYSSYIIVSIGDYVTNV